MKASNNSNKKPNSHKVGKVEISKTYLKSSCKPPRPNKETKKPK